MDEGFFPSDHFGLLFEFAIGGIGIGSSGADAVPAAVEERVPLPPASSKRRKA